MQTFVACLFTVATGYAVCPLPKVKPDTNEGNTCQVVDRNLQLFLTKRVGAIVDRARVEGSDRAILLMRPKFLRLLTHPNSIALIVLAGCLLAGWQLMQGDRNPADWLRSIADLGFAGKLAYVGILMLAIVFSPIPGTPIVVAAGAVWEPLTAAVYGVVGIFAGCLLAYFLGRTLGRSMIRSLTGKTLHLSSDRGELYLGWVVFITHLLPIAPFDLISYAAGMAGLSFPIYAVSTLLGTIPCVVFLAYLGASLTVSLPVGLAIAAVFLILLIVLPLGVQRYNWFGIKDSIRIDESD